MADSALLQFMRRVVTEDARGAADPPLVILPAVHDAMETDHDAIQAIIERYSGSYLRCDNAASAVAVKGPINAVAAEYLRQLCRSRNMNVVFSESNGVVQVRTEEDAPPTGSLPVLLRVLAYLVSGDLARRPLTVLSYPLTGLDERRQGLLWEATLAPGLFPPDTLRTFVPIAGGQVDVVRHCSRAEGGVRYVIRDGELIERGETLLLADSLRMILRRFDQPLVLFLGAGASASSGLPQGNYLRDRALAALVNKPVGSTELLSSFRTWLGMHHRWMSEEEALPPDVFARTLTLERVLREEFFALSGMPIEQSVTVTRMQRDCRLALDRQPEGRQALWRLAELLPRLVVVTVNFDQLIELGMSGAHTVIVRDEEFLERRGEVLARLRGEPVPLPILKLHGSIEAIDTLVADISATKRGLQDEVVATLNAMVSEVGCVTWVWVGCSMRDADVGAWLAGKHGVDEIQEWWVDPLPPRSVQVYAEGRRRWEWASIQQELRDRQITETSDRFLSQLAARAEDLRAESTAGGEFC
jgi:hypothetical protein